VKKTVPKKKFQSKSIQATIIGSKGDVTPSSMHKNHKFLLCWYTVWEYLQFIHAQKMKRIFTDVKIRRQNT